MIILMPYFLLYSLLTSLWVLPPSVVLYFFPLPLRTIKFVGVPSFLKAQQDCQLTTVRKLRRSKLAVRSIKKSPGVARVTHDSPQLPCKASRLLRHSVTALSSRIFARGSRTIFGIFVILKIEISGRFHLSPVRSNRKSSVEFIPETFRRQLEDACDGEYLGHSGVCLVRRVCGEGSWRGTLSL